MTSKEDEEQFFFKIHFVGSMYRHSKNAGNRTTWFSPEICVYKQLNGHEELVEKAELGESSNSQGFILLNFLSGLRAKFLNPLAQKYKIRNWYLPNHLTMYQTAKESAKEYIELNQKVFLLVDIDTSKTVGNVNIEVLPSTAALLVKALVAKTGKKEDVQNYYGNKQQNFASKYYFYEGNLSLEDDIVPIAKYLQKKERTLSKTLAGTINQVLGTVLSLGKVTVDSKHPTEIQKEVSSGFLHFELSEAETKEMERNRGKIYSKHLLA